MDYVPGNIIHAQDQRSSTTETRTGPGARGRLPGAVTSAWEPFTTIWPEPKSAALLASSPGLGRRPALRAKSVRFRTCRYREPERALPDFAAYREQAPQESIVTLNCSGKNIADNPDGYQYSQFCYLYQRWRAKLDVVLRQDYKAGEKLFVDWAGPTIPIYPPTGDRSQAHLFVAVLGASSYTYAEATADEQMINWLGATCGPSSSSAACRKLIVPDNPKTAVTAPAATSRT